MRLRANLAFAAKQPLGLFCLQIAKHHGAILPLEAKLPLPLNKVATFDHFGHCIINRPSHDHIS